MKLLYIAGKYCDARGEWYQHLNIELSKRVARFFWMKGYAVICPHSNTAFMGDSCPDNWDRWLNGDLEILGRCDMIVMLPNYLDSPGALKELEHAIEMEKDITYVVTIRDGLVWDDNFTLEVIE